MSKQVMPSDEVPQGATSQDARPQLRLTPTRRGKAPIHWADLDAQGRKEAMVGLGLPEFRAAQLSAHYFGHGLVDTHKMTDLPAGVRADLAQFFSALDQ